MTSNGTLIDEKCVLRLAQAGMKTIAISLDGLKATHEQLRGVPGSYDLAVNALRLLKKSEAFRTVQTVTVVSELNIRELPQLFELVSDLQIDSWKITPIEPMGDAKGRQDLFLDEKSIISFLISSKRSGSVHRLKSHTAAAICCRRLMKLK